MAAAERSVPVMESVPAERPVNRYSPATRSGAEDWEQLVDEHLILVRRLARRTAESIQRLDLLDDLLQSGFFGLVEAARRFCHSTGKDFSGFASKRIQGAMIDEIRRQDWRPRRISRFAARVSRQMGALEQTLGHAATEKEIAQSLGMTLQDYQKALEDIECGQLEALIDEPEDQSFSCQKGNGETWLMQQELAEQMSRVIEQLPVNERQLLDFFYQQGMHQCEIALVFGVTEARISQLHKQALLRLRAFLQQNLDTENVPGFNERSGADKC